VAKNNKQNMIDFVARLNKQIEATTGPAEMRKIGGFLIQKIAVRTRLGNGVMDHLAEKSKLKPLSPKYIEFRKSYGQLYNMTTPKRSNLTLTGSMIDSLRIKAIGKNSIRIGPTGTDRNGVSNSSKAYWQEKAGRVFLRLSRQEVKQARIFWMRTFSDLLK
jgi:hypothetical protein